MTAPARLLVTLCAALLPGCRSYDPQQELEVSGVETYWALDRPSGTTQYLAPVVRLHVRNKGPHVLRSVQATATFRRQGETATWGSDWKPLTASDRPLGPGPEVLVVLKSDARYYSGGAVEGMFAHPQWKDANVEVFLRIGPSSWSKFVSTGIERRLGARGVQEEQGGATVVAPGAGVARP
ncbi:MAG TPA: hypothetical protein VII13_19575 [Vicinamibacteria bacterium]